MKKKIPTNRIGPCKVDTYHSIDIFTRVEHLSIESALQPNPPPRLPLPNLKHHLHAHKQRRACNKQVHHPRITPHDPHQQPLDPIQSQRKPNEVRRHHHEDVAHSSDAAQHAIRGRARAPFARGEKQAADDFGQHEESDEPAPRQQAQADVVPERNKGEDHKEIKQAAGFCEHGVVGGAAPATASHRHVQVPHHPPVERAVPRAPEGERGVVVRRAADHVLGRIDAVDERPESEEAPRDEQFEPDVVQVEVAQHAELERRVCGPVRGGLGDGHDVDVVQNKLHAEEREEKADAVEDGTGAG